MKKKLILTTVISVFLATSAVFVILYASPWSSQEPQTTPTPTATNSSQLTVEDANNSILIDEQKPSTASSQPKDEETIEAKAGESIVLIDGTVKPQEYTDKILDPSEPRNEKVWAHVSDVIDAGNLESLDVETICQINPETESTICPYIYLQTSHDLKNWHLLTVSNTSPPRGGRTTYDTDLSKLRHGRYYRYVLRSKRCEGAVCREGRALTGSYTYKLTATYSE